MRRSARIHRRTSTPELLIAGAQCPHDESGDCATCSIAGVRSASSLDFPPDEYDYLIGPILTSWSVARAEQASAITCGMRSRATSA